MDAVKSLRVGYGTAGDFQVIGDALGADVPAELHTGETGNATNVMQAHYGDLVGAAALALGTTNEKITATCNKAGTRIYLSAPRGSGTGSKRAAQAQAPVVVVNPVDAFFASVEIKAQAVADALGVTLDEARDMVTARYGDNIGALNNATQAIADAQAQVELAQAFLDETLLALALAQQAQRDALATLA